MRAPRRAPSGAVAWAGLAALFAAAVGCATGEPPAAGAAGSASASAPHAPPARAYRELREAPRGPNARVHGRVSSELAERLPDPEDGALASEADRELALGARARRRAYEGAPPTVPHEVTQATVDCAGCHTRGGVLAERTAPRMSHGPLPSCTQCHVPERAPGGLREAGVPDGDEDNAFVGLRGPLRGERAYAGAPPTIPHSTRMRSECTSCHGPSGQVGLRTPHPHQVSCTQCHAPSASLDQVPGSEEMP